MRVGLTADGQLNLQQGATDIGQRSNTVITQICADALGVRVGDFALIGPDTALTPDCVKTSASRQTFVPGKVAHPAGTALRNAILGMVNMGVDARIELADGMVKVADDHTTSSLDLGGLEPYSRGYALSAEETYDPPTIALDPDGKGAPCAQFGYGAQVAEVVVDMDLGTTRVTCITAGHDLGRAINLLLAEGQAQGGIAQGLGEALMEELVPRSHSKPARLSDPDHGRYA
jgi:CO/xanthine dehydrogenase Mo-binding subunit